MTYLQLPRIFDRRGASLDGQLHPDFTGVAGALKSQLRSYAGGAAVCIYHRGQKVVDLWGGAKNRAGSAWTRDTMAPSFSTGKGVASTLLHMMVDRGLLDYEDRVAQHWPEFAQAGKETITVRHVLAHEAGLYHIRQMIDHADRMLDWDHRVGALARAEPLHVPGERSGYHGLTFGFLVGEILRRVTGKHLPQLIREELAGPLALDGMYIGAPEQELDRAAELIWPMRGRLLQDRRIGPAVEKASAVAGTLLSPLRTFIRLSGIGFDFGSVVDALAPRGISAFDFGSRETLRSVIPSGNGLFTARSLARMYAALAGGGQIDGVRLLSHGTLARATEVQSNGKRRAVLPFNLRWRLGYHGVGTTRGFPPQAFGHFGYGGSGAWADPSRELAVAMVVNCGMGTPFGDIRTARISGAALASADRRSPPRRSRL